VADLDKPLAFADNSFRFVTCVGVLAYVEAVPQLLREWIRLVRQGGLVCFSQADHRWCADERGIQTAAAALESDGLWTCLHASDPLPYMPNNPQEEERAMRVRYFAYRIE